MIDMDNADRFFEMVEAVEVLQVQMAEADGELERILAIAQDAGFELEVEALVAAATRRTNAAVAASAGGRPGAGPSQEVSHPAVYLNNAEDATACRCGHPQVYLAELDGPSADQVAPGRYGHPEVYVAEMDRHAADRYGHPAVYLADADRASTEHGSDRYGHPAVYLADADRYGHPAVYLSAADRYGHPAVYLASELEENGRLA